MEHKRVVFLKALLVLAISVIVARLFYVQIIEHDYYVAKATDEHVSINTIPAARGKIYMMDGDDVVPVVLNETVYTVIFDPSIVNEEKSKEVFEKYAKDKMIAKWEDIFQDKNRRYFIVARGINYTTAEKIVKELNDNEVFGVVFEKTSNRIYPEGELASGVLGFVNVDGEGQYGVEGSLNERLSGVDGNLKAVRDVNGVVLSIGDENIETPAVDGEDIVLSIDRNVELNVEKILKKYIDSTDANKASAIILDPNNGKVIAMANIPTYDPSRYTDVQDVNAFRNSIVDEPYEAASVCKTFTFATGIELGVMNANTTYYNSDQYTVDGLTLGNAYKGLIGTLTMQTAFNYSLNTGSSVALELISGGNGITQAGREKLYEFYNKFRLGKNTGIEIYESTGFVPSPNEYDYTMNFTYANTTFGQAMNLTMIQIASAFSAVVNGGYYHEPSVVIDEKDDYEQEDIKDKELGEKVLSGSTSEQMREMLHETRKSKRLNGIDREGYYIGGKTGTGQVVQDDGSYSEASEKGETIGSYIGFGGREGKLPEYVVMIKLWGDGKHLGGEMVTPVFDEISNYLIDYLKIEPNL